MALARALAIEPRMLLLDEPFGALDARVRKELRAGLREIHDQTGLTTVFVTHDQDEAMELADLVVVMSMGRIEQIGTPKDDPHPTRDPVRRASSSPHDAPGARPGTSDVGSVPSPSLPQVLPASLGDFRHLLIAPPHMRRTLRSSARHSRS